MYARWLAKTRICHNLAPMHHIKTSDISKSNIEYIISLHLCMLEMCEKCLILLILVNGIHVGHS